MKVSVQLDGKQKFETDLPESEAVKLFNRFVSESLLNSFDEEEEEYEKVVEDDTEWESVRECIFGEEEEDKFNLKETEDTNTQQLGRNHNYSRRQLVPKGFLYIQCDKCGKRHGFCSKKEISHYRCDDCGYDTIIEPHKLKRMIVSCENCGDTYNYITNLIDDKFMAQCFNCKDIISMYLFRRDNIYYVDKEV